MTDFLITLFLVGMTTLLSFGQETPKKEAPSEVIGPGDHTRTLMMGDQPPVSFIGRSAKSISANDSMWEFFQNHPMK